MQTSTLVILGVIILLAVVALVLIAARSSRMRHPALKPLSPEAQDRYVSQWDRIEAKFVDSPEEAVKEADALLLAMLGEREHPLAGEKLPRRMRKARDVATGREAGTEGMRQALLHYRAVSTSASASPTRTHAGRSPASAPRPPGQAIA